MKKIKTFLPIYLLGIIFCAGLCAGMYFVGVKPLLRINNVINNGTEAVAIVTDVRESNVTINDEPTYNFYVEFTDENGERISGWTLDYFQYDKAMDIADEKEVTVRYIGNDIVYGKNLLSTTGIGTLLFSAACVVLGLITVFLLFMCIKTLLTAMALNGILQSGKSVLATFLSKGKSMTMGKTSYCSVIYEYKNDNGKTIQVKSPKNYTNEEVEQLEQASNFEVKVKNGKSMIAHIFD